jgi:hypothetical protein
MGDDFAKTIAMVDAQLDRSMVMAFRHPGNSTITGTASHWATMALALRARTLSHSKTKEDGNG